MKRDLFISAYPSPNLQMEQSLGVNLLTNIQLTDYFLNNSSYSSEWFNDFSSQLSKAFIEALSLLRTVFAHTVILREFYIINHKDLNEDWERFIAWWKEMSEEQTMDLLIYGIRENMNYYYKFLPCVPIVEETMKDVSLEEKELRNPANRRRAIKAVLQSWLVEDIEKSLIFYDDLKLVKEKIILLIEQFWFCGFKQLWEKEGERLDEWQRKNNCLISKFYRTNDEALLEVTGLSPDTNEMDNIKRAESMTFIPVFNLDRLFILFEVDQHMYIMFEPSEDRSVEPTKEPDFTAISPAFEGMGDQTRLQIIGLLAENREMFAQQIVMQLGIKQSTISRHLNQLDKSGLVSIRRVGNTKYFSINPDEIRKVINVLQTFLK